MEGKKFNSVTKVTTVNSNQSLLLTDQNGNVTSIGMDALKADLAVGQHAWCGRALFNSIKVELNYFALASM